MAISRMQMNRQLYAGGGIMDVTPREKFGLGSKLKKFVRKVIPNEVADIATKAAPFVAPFNPLLAGAMAGIGSFDQTGSISKGLKSGLLNYGGGQLARYVGGAGFQQGFNPFAGADFSGGLMSGIQSLGSSPIGTETGLRLGQYEMFGGTPTQQVVSSGQSPLASEGSIATGIDSSKAYLPTDFATEALPLEQATKSLTQTAAETAKRSTMDITKDLFSGDFTKMGNAAKELGGKGLKAIYTKPVPGSPGETQIDKLAIGATIAGGMSYLEAKKLAEEAGIVDDPEEYTEEMYNADKSRYSNYYSQILTPAAFGLKDGGRIGYAIGSPEPDGKNVGIQSIKLEETKEQPEGIKTLMASEDYGALIDAYEKGIDVMEGESLTEYINRIRAAEKKANGGRIGYAMGTEVPMRENQGGVTELDYRNTGGFVPIGVKEKADDVPAMLSKNEFVFTADAVRAAGGGSVNKGAQKMYDLMKSLENKVV
jgi:hypothetical protein